VKIFKKAWFFDYFSWLEAVKDKYRLIYLLFIIYIFSVAEKLEPF